MEYTVDYFAGRVESALKEINYPTEAPRLFEPVRYTLDSGGKRLRPALLLATFAAEGEADLNKAMPAALAVEMFHNFTLLHDDVMDHAELRRGRPTVHCRWNDNVAILSGDAMLTLSLQLLEKCDADRLPAVLKLFNETAMEVYQGQQLDMEFEYREDVSVDEYVEMIRLKTSVLLACSCAMGTLLAGAPDDDTRKFYQYGLNLGLAFQLRDDWLDTYGDPAIFGKEIGGDIVNRKKTWLLINAITENKARIDEIFDGGLREDEIVDAVRTAYDELDLGRRCSAVVADYSKKAADCLDGIVMTPGAREFFSSLALKAALRNH